MYYVCIFMLLDLSKLQRILYRLSRITKMNFSNLKIIVLNNETTKNIIIHFYFHWYLYLYLKKYLELLIYTKFSI